CAQFRASEGLWLLVHLLHCPENLPYALATGNRLPHLFSLDSISAVGAGASPNSRIPSRPSGQASGPSGSMRFGLGPDRYFSPPPLIAATAVSPAPGFSPGISLFIRSPGLAAFARRFRSSKPRLLELNLRADLFERGL